MSIENALYKFITITITNSRKTTSLRLVRASLQPPELSCWWASCPKGWDGKPEILVSA